MLQVFFQYTTKNRSQRGDFLKLYVLKEVGMNKDFIVGPKGDRKFIKPATSPIFPVVLFIEKCYDNTV